MNQHEKRAVTQLLSAQEALWWSLFDTVPQSATAALRQAQPRRRGPRRGSQQGTMVGCEMIFRT